MYPEMSPDYRMPEVFVSVVLVVNLPKVAIFILDFRFLQI